MNIKMSKFLKVKYLLALGVFGLLSYVIVVNQLNRLRIEEIRSNAFDADEDFEMYVDKFYRDIEYHGIFKNRPGEMVIKFSKLDELSHTNHIHGLSLGVGDDTKIEIYINPSSWKKFSKPLRYYLMYHELSHDVLNLDDYDYDIKFQGELMYPAISSYESMDMDDFIESSHRLFSSYNNVN